MDKDEKIQELQDEIQELEDRVSDLEGDLEKEEEKVQELRNEIIEYEEKSDTDFYPDFGGVVANMKYEFFMENFDKITQEQLETLIK